MAEQELPWVNYEEALARIKALDDPLVEQFVMRGVTVVVQRFSSGNFPAEKLDLLYLAEVLIELFGQKEELVRLFSGKDTSWFGA